MSTIKLKRSGESGSAPGPDDLVHGELAVNYADNKLYTLGHGGSVIDLLEVGERVGVSAWNGQSGMVVFNDYVSSFNGLSGAVQGVSGWNGATGQVVFNDYVSSFNGSSGDVTTCGVTTCVGGVTLGGGGATFSGTVVVPTLTATTGVNATALNMNSNYALPTGAGATGDVLMIANDGDLEFESLKTTATFIVDSDIPLATGIRYKGLYAVPLPKMDVVSIELRSHDVSPAGSGDSLSVALKFIRTGLESASPTIQGTVETVAIPLGGEYHTAVSEGSIGTGLLESYEVGSDNAANYLVVDVVSNAGNHTNFTMLVTMEARP